MLLNTVQLALVGSLVAGAQAATCIKRSTTASSLSSATSLPASTTSSSASSTTSTALGCTVTPTSGATDDTPAIQAAIKACPSGTVVLPEGSVYTIGSQLTFTGCKGCTVQLDGTLNVTVDFDYWNNKGEIIHVDDIDGATLYSKSGTGLIDGNGQASWDYIVDGDTSYKRPNLFRCDGCTNFRMTGLYIRASPQFHVITSGNSKNVYYSNITLYSVSDSDNVAHNTDGFDIGPASYVTVENVHVTNDDDCIVLKPGADNVQARDIYCDGGHGLSVGSLGSSHGSNDSVTNSVFERATMVNNAKATGLKLYPGGPLHGSAFVSNVTWRDIYVDGCEYGMQIQSCYSAPNATYCAQYPSTATLVDVVWQNVTGVTDGHYKDVVANMNCPAGGLCDIHVSGFDVVSPTGGETVLCANVPADAGITCTSGASG